MDNTDIKEENKVVYEKDVAAVLGDDFPTGQ